MATSKIRWTRSDYSRLSRAVADFNKRVSSIEKEENNLYLPDIKTYQQYKGEIITRQDLNRLIKSLKRIKNKGALELIESQGELKTKWQMREESITIATYKRKIGRELKKIQLTKKEKPYITQAEKELIGRLQRVENLKNLTGGEFRQQYGYIKYFSSAGYNYTQREKYMINYKSEMKKYSDLENYDKLEGLFESITDPNEFYNLIKDDVILKDLTLQSDTTYSQNEFNKFLENLGIIIDNEYNSTELKNYKLINEETEDSIFTTDDLKVAKNMKKFYKKENINIRIIDSETGETI